MVDRLKALANELERHITQDGCAARSLAQSWCSARPRSRYSPFSTSKLRPTNEDSTMKTLASLPKGRKLTKDRAVWGEDPPTGPLLHVTRHKITIKHPELS